MPGVLASQKTKVEESVRPRCFETSLNNIVGLMRSSQVRTLAAKSDSPNLIPTAHMVKGEK